MKLPRVLVIDDQYARDATERGLFLDRTGLTVADQPRRQAGAVAAATICSGQVSDDGSIRNDYAMIREAVEGDDWALVLLDARFDSGPRNEKGLPAGAPGDEDFGESVRRQLQVEVPGLPVVMLTGKRQKELEELGTPLDTPYFSKTDFDRRRLRQALLQYGRVSTEQSRRLLEIDAETVLESPVVLAAFRQVFVHAPQNVSVLILGESGVGKEVLARFVDKQSGRRGPFVALNIAAVPASLLESELFGIERRIATEVDSRPGVFEQASGGTLFLDEIGDMPLEAQPKVLRVLEERTVRRVGGQREIPFDVRLVSATSRDLRALISQGQFREELYYRVNDIIVAIPPLRDRLEEIVPLAEMFLRRFCAEFNLVGVSFAAEALELLRTQPFPGNVRELKKLVGRLASGASNHRVISATEVQNALDIQSLTWRPEEPRPPLSLDYVAAVLESLAIEKDDPAPAGVLSRLEGVVADLRKRQDGLTRQPKPAPVSPSLNDVTVFFESVAIDKDDPALSGVLPRFENAVADLRRRLVGAGLELTRNRLSGEFNRQGAMQLISGDKSLKGKGPQRLINDILGRKQEQDVSDSDLEKLVLAWRQGASQASGRFGKADQAQ